MAAQPRIERCKERLTERARRDAFLSQVDERPKLDHLLATLDKSLTEYEKQPRERVRTLGDELRSGVATLEKTLRGVRAQIVELFAPLKSVPTAVDALQRAAKALYDQTDYLARRVRHRMLHVLDRAAPETNLIPTILKALGEYKRAEIDKLPEAITLLRRRRDYLPYEAGKAVLELAYIPRLEKLCRSRLLTRVRHYLFRHRLKRLYRLLDVPIQDMAQDALVLRTELVPAQLEKRHAATHRELDTRLNDSWRALRYNIETAAVELDDLCELPEAERREALESKLAELETMALKAVDQAIESLGEVPVVYASVLEGIVEAIVQDHDHALKAIGTGVEQSDSLRGRLRWARKSFRKSIHQRWWQLRNLAEKKLLPFLAGIANYLREHAERLSFAVRDRLGIAKVAEETLLRIADLPPVAEVQERARALPPIYRRLFSTQPLYNREFLVGRDDELATLEDALGRWQSGRAASVAIVGPEGSGKSSLINCFESELEPSIEVVHIDVTERLRSTDDVIRILSDALAVAEPCTTLGELEQQLLTLPRRLLIVEQGHNIHLRTVGGRDAPEAFFHVVMATRSHFLWLTSFRHHPWVRLKYLFDAERYYTHVIASAFQDEIELKESLLRRQRAAGQQLLFSDDSSPSKQVKKLRLTYDMVSPPVQAALEDDYFETLFKVTGGNIEAALFFWLQSLRIDNQGRILTRPCLKLDDRFIANLDRFFQFTLAELLGHGGLTPAEHAAIFCSDTEYSRRILDYLRQLRLVDGRGADNIGQPLRYAVSPVFHHSTVDILRNKNILY